VRADNCRPTSPRYRRSSLTLPSNNLVQLSTSSIDNHTRSCTQSSSAVRTSLLNPVYTIQPVVKPVVVWQPAVYTIQPFVKPIWQPVVSCIQTFYQVVKRVWQPVWQQVVLCRRGFTNYRPQWGLCFCHRLWLFCLFVHEISRGTAERICAKFTGKTCLSLARTSFNVKVKGHGSRSLGTNFLAIENAYYCAGCK